MPSNYQAVFHKSGSVFALIRLARHVASQNFKIFNFATRCRMLVLHQKYLLEVERRGRKCKCSQLEVCTSKSFGPYGPQQKISVYLSCIKMLTLITSCKEFQFSSIIVNKRQKFLFTQPLLFESVNKQPTYLLT